MDIVIELESLDKKIEDKIFNIGWEVGFEHMIFMKLVVLQQLEVGV